MFRVTGEDGGIILETSHKPTAEQSQRQYEASMGKKAKLIDLDEVAPAGNKSEPQVKSEQVSAAVEKEDEHLS